MLTHQNVPDVKPENEQEVAGPSNSESDSEVRRTNNDGGSGRRQKEKYKRLVCKHRRLLERQLDVALRKKKLQLEYMKKEIEMKRQLHQLKMQMLKSEIEYKKQVLALMNEDAENV